jgi:replication factor C subunit 3/5
MKYSNTDIKKVSLLNQPTEQVEDDVQIVEKVKLPYIEKFRPNDFHSLVDHDDKVNILTNLISKNELPHLLFYGSVGTGKTSMILNVAKKMYGQDYRMYTLELNASDDRGIDIVRNKIPNFIRISSNKIRIVILDEADAMTQDAQSALRRVMEIYSKNCRFCLICNNVNKIIPGIQSRCAKMRFSVLNKDGIRNRLEQIIEEESINIENDAIDKLSELKDFRIILNTLQCLHTVKSDKITVKDIYNYLGKPTTDEIVEIVLRIKSLDYKDAYDYLINKINTHRYNSLEILDELSQVIIKEDFYDWDKKMIIIEKLSAIENRISSGRDSAIQLSYLVAVLKL